MEEARNGFKTWVTRPCKAGPRVTAETVLFTPQRARERSRGRFEPASRRCSRDHTIDVVETPCG
eukprot:1628237-Amphidinium_carterae.1